MFWAELGVWCIVLHIKLICVLYRDTKTLQSAVLNYVALLHAELNLKKRKREESNEGQGKPADDMSSINGESRNAGAQTLHISLPAEPI